MPKKPVIEVEEDQKPKKKVTTVKAALKSLDLSKAGSGIQLIIGYDEGKLGEIVIGHGSLNWKPAGSQTFLKVSWKDFAARVLAEKPIF